MAEKNIEKILDKDSKNFIVDYCGIEAVVIKNGYKIKTNKYKYKKKGDINRRNRKQKREKDKTNSGKKNYAQM